MDTKMSLLSTLIQCGVCKGGDNDVIRFMCYDNFIEIRLSRSQVSRFAAVDHQYICKMEFFDTVAQRSLLVVDFSEISALTIINSIYSWAEFNMSYEIAVPLDSVKSTGNYFILVFEKLFATDEDIDQNLYAMNVNEYIASTGQVVTRLHVRFKIGDAVVVDGDLMDFVDLMYFAFLVDIDMGGNMPPDPTGYIF